MNKKNIITIVLILVFGFVVLFLATLSSKTSVKEEKFNSISLLTDNDFFFSISNAISKYYQNKDDEAYSKSILKDSNGNFDNSTDNNFTAREIYYVQSEKKYVFFVKGISTYNSADDADLVSNKKFYKVYYDIHSNAYQIEYITNKEYDNYINKKNINYSFNDIKNNQYNNFEVSNITNKDLALIYFNDFINKIYWDPDFIYNSFSSNMKNVYPTRESFISIVDNNFDYFYELHILKYNVTNNVISIKDNKNNEYTFNVLSPYNYKIEFKLEIE